MTFRTRRWVAAEGCRLWQSSEFIGTQPVQLSFASLDLSRTRNKEPCHVYMVRLLFFFIVHAVRCTPRLSNLITGARLYKRVGWDLSVVQGLKRPGCMTLSAPDKRVPRWQG